MKARLENPIQREILDALGAEPDLLLFRNNVGQARHADEKTGRVFFVPYGLGTGSPDVVGILRRGRVGIWFCLELKRPGEEPDPHQEKCHAVWRAFGACVGVATSVDEARAALEEARRLELT